MSKMNLICATREETEVARKGILFVSMVNMPLLLIFNRECITTVTLIPFSDVKETIRLIPAESRSDGGIGYQFSKSVCFTTADI